jgi:transcriptional regulator with XRE-family HTH domain
MGSSARPRPARLAEKLRVIRSKLGLSQNGMIRRLGLKDEIIQADISAYELDQREPPLHVLLNYSRSANILVEVLIDDNLDLPKELPSSVKHEGVPHATVRRRDNKVKRRVKS